MLDSESLTCFEKVGRFCVIKACSELGLTETPSLFIERHSFNLERAFKCGLIPTLDSENLVRLNNEICRSRNKPQADYFDDCNEEGWDVGPVLLEEIRSIEPSTKLMRLSENGNDSQSSPTGGRRSYIFHYECCATTTFHRLVLFRQMQRGGFG